MSTVHKLVPIHNQSAGTSGNKSRKAGGESGKATKTVSSPPRRKARPSVDAHISLAHLRAHGFIDPRGDRSLLAEEMRVIKRPLLTHAMISERGARDRVILVTSARPGEGKTFTSINLALSLAQERDARVVLIDADTTMRGTQLALGIENDRPGLTEFLAGQKVSLANILQKTNIPRLTFIGAGEAGNGNPELYSSRRMARAIEALLGADERLIVVIDAPPVLATSEALAIAPLAGQTLFVVEAGATARDAVEQAVELIAEHTDVQLMLNKATAGRAQRNYSYYYYAEYNQTANKEPARKPSWWRRLFMTAPLGLGLGLWVTMAAAPVALAGWVVVPHIELASAFVDNVEDEDDGEKDSDLVGKVAPGVRIEGKEPFLNVVMDYTLEAMGFARHRHDSDLNHKFKGGARAKLIDNLVYLDLQGEIGDTLIDNVGPTSVSEFVTTDKRVNEYSGSISPYIKRKLGDWAEVEARYQLTRLTQNDNSLADVTATTYSGSLESLDKTGPLSWTLRGFRDEANYDGTRDEEARHSTATLGALDTSYRINDQLALLGGIGYSQIKDDTLNNNTQTGPYWQVGFEARPTPRTRVRATGGQMFEQPNIDVKAEWQPTAKLSINSNYVNRLSSRFDRFRREIEQSDPFDERNDTPDDIQIALDDILPDNAITRRGEELYQDQYLDLNVNSQIGRNYFRVGGIVEKRDFDSADDQKSYGANLSWLRELNQRTQLRFGSSWRHVDFGDGPNKDEVTLTAALVQQLTPSAALSFGYEFDKSLVDGGRNETTNTVYVRLRKEF
ncbi:MAG: TIGR03016 family PEP-CTERM system-associated outer membrane protein [Geminicoccaceae bacterium]|nr:TIGR03016 family PEP-CTERM system-associated outer membrane protein [Geminicoccaceae bacterium]